MVLRTLHGYILRELLKTFAATTMVLTVVLSLGGLLQPLRHHGVSAVQLFQLIIYLFPVMLTFSLPLAALLAASLCYGRLSSDNELIACRASGVSLHALVTPAAALGGFVLVANLLLSNWLIPVSAAAAEDIVTDDIQDIAFNKLRNDGQLGYGSWVVTCDRAYRDADRPNEIQLVAPSMLRLADGVPREQVLANAARLEFETTDEGHTIVTIYPRNAIRMPWEGNEEPMRVYSLILSRKLPPIVSEEVESKTYWQLRVLLADPSPYPRVRRYVEQARQVTAHKMLYEQITEALSQGRSYEMDVEVPRGDGMGRGRAVIEGDNPAVRDKDLVIGIGGAGGGANVRISLYDEQGELMTKYEANQAVLEAVSREDTPGPVVGVHFPGEVERQSPRIGPEPARRYNVPMTERLLAPRGLVRQVAGLNISELRPDPGLAVEIRKQERRVRREIVAELHRRGAFSVAGLLLVILGTLLGILFRSGHVLVAFGVSALPAMFAITMVIMGEQVATSSQSNIDHLGLWLIWTGNIVILGISGFVYARMMKN